MNITFTSKIKQNGKENKIEFVSPVTITQENDFKIFEFREPSQNIMNRIEVSEKYVNIFAGITSINLEKGKENQVEYSTPNGSLFLQAKLYSLEQKENLVNFFYSLKQNNKLIGEYDITLKVSPV